MSRVYITSDQHFFHENIIKYENRPFKSVEEMNEFMIQEWNKKVRKRDIVYCLGDFTFNRKVSEMKELISKLNGKKVLVMGNHDKKTMSMYYEAGFDEVYKNSIIYKEFFILSHVPVYLSADMPYINVHGHIHSKEFKDERYVNVCVELHNYAPVLFDDIKKSLKISDESIKEYRAMVWDNRHEEENV